MQTTRTTCTWLLALLTCAPAWARTAPGKEKLVLTPETVTSRTLEEGLEATAARLQAKRSELPLSLARSKFDYRLQGAANYRYSEAESVEQPLEGSTEGTTFESSLTKGFETGTSVSVGVTTQKLLNDKEVPSVGGGRGGPGGGGGAPSGGGGSGESLFGNSGTSIDTSLTIRQNLWRNAFGEIDALELENAKLLRKEASLRKREGLEDAVSQTLAAYWNVVVARESVAIREDMVERYRQLVQEVREKRQYNVDAPGELQTVSAEYEQMQQQLEVARTQLAVEKAELKKFLGFSADQRVAIEPPEFPSTEPALNSPEVSKLRLVKAIRQKIEQARGELALARHRDDPKVTGLLQAKTTGVEEEAADAFEEMADGTKPTYLVGVELETPLFSHRSRGQIHDKTVALQQAETRLKTSVRDLTTALSTLRKQLTQSFSSARRLERVLNLRENAVREQEEGYNEGRVILTELIRSFNTMQQTKLQWIQAQGRYRKAQARYRAMADRLLSGDDEAA